MHIPSLSSTNPLYLKLTADKIDFINSSDIGKHILIKNNRLQQIDPSRKTPPDDPATQIYRELAARRIIGSLNISRTKYIWVKNYQKIDRAHQKRT